MKFRSLFLSGVAALLLTSTAAAQFNPNNLTSEGDFHVVSRAFGTQGHGVMLGNAVGYGNIDIWCVDFAGSLHVGADHTYYANFTSLASDAADLDSRTHFGSAKLTGYLKAAYLYKHLKAATLANDSETARDISFAIWHFMTPGSPAAARAGEIAWRDLADANYGEVGDARWYFVVTDKDPTNLEGGRLDIRHQEFLTYATPEPGTYALLATGLIGLSFAGIRRRKKDIV